MEMVQGVKALDMGGLDWSKSNNMQWLINIRWYALAAMLVAHSARVYIDNPTIKFILLMLSPGPPAFAFGIAVGAELTRDWKKYGLRILVIAILSQPFWGYVNISGHLLNDVFALFVGLVAIEIERKRRFMGAVVVLAAILGPISGLMTFLVWVSWVLRKRQLELGVVYCMIGVVLAVIIEPHWIKYSYLGIAIFVLPLIKAPKLPRRKYFQYSIYPVHLALIAAINFLILGW